MKRKKKEYAKCPCCKIEKRRTEMKIAIAEMEKLDAANAFIGSDFECACDDCLESKKAILANPSLQNYCWDPYYAYFDSKIICRTCSSEFIFSKNEKKFWFENLKFWIDSTPVNCLNCRKEIKQLKAENKTLSDILKKAEDKISTSELPVVIDIYTKWQKESRAKYYKSILRKR